MSYYFYINEILLPITPSELSIKVKNQNKTLNLVDGSEHNITKIPGLSEISFEAAIPNIKYPFAVYENSDFIPAAFFLSEFEKLKVNCSVFKFRVIRKDGFGDTDFDCTIEDYTIKERAASGTDYIVSFKLKQYTYQRTLTFEFTSASDNSEAVINEERPVKKEAETISHTVISGDTLWGIAKRYYGDGSRHPEIYADNKDVIENAAKKYGRASSSNGWWIYPGTVLTIKNAVK